MCSFVAGEQVVCISDERDYSVPWRPKVGAVYTVARVHCRKCADHLKGLTNQCGIDLVEMVDHPGWWTYSASDFRKVQRKKTDLSLEAFFKVPGGFEEPKRAPTAPAKTREGAQ